MTTRSLSLREIPRAGDERQVERVLASTGFFRDEEIEVGVEVVHDGRARGLESGYRFLFADASDDGRDLAGFTCYGNIACTVGSYDLYWIAVDAARRGHGIGRWLLSETELRIRALGGRRVYAETSGSAQYDPTHLFYERSGYSLVAKIPDFYRVGDPKWIYAKVLMR